MNTVLLNGQFWRVGLQPERFQKGGGAASRATGEMRAKHLINLLPNALLVSNAALHREKVAADTDHRVRRQKVLAEQDFVEVLILHLCHPDVTKSACPTAAEKCLSTAICPYSRWRSQPLSRVSRKQRYNTLDFAEQNRVPRWTLSPLDTLCQQGCYSPLLDDPEPKGLCPSGHLACPCSGYPSCSCTMVPPYPNRKDQARKSTQNKGEFPCLVHCL